MGWISDAKNRQRSRTDNIECQAQHKEISRPEQGRKSSSKHDPENAYAEWELNTIIDNEIEKHRIVAADEALERRRQEEAEKMRREQEIEQWREEEARKERGDLSAPVVRKKKRRKPKPETFWEKVLRKIREIFS